MDLKDIQLALLVAVALATAVFLVTRVYLLVSKGELDVKGMVYSRRETPILYWAIFVNAVVGIILTLSIAGFGIFGLWVSI